MRTRAPAFRTAAEETTRELKWGHTFALRSSGSLSRKLLSQSDLQGQPASQHTGLNDVLSADGRRLTQMKPSSICVHLRHLRIRLSNPEDGAAHRSAVAAHLMRASRSTASREPVGLRVRPTFESRYFARSSPASYFHAVIVCAPSANLVSTKSSKGMA
jgi:hypothetical protein